MDYYFGDQLRWSFGFDNPNMAAALIASALPWAWAMWDAAWRCVPAQGRKAEVLAGGAIVGALGLILAGWWMLLATLSRGAVVAAVVAFGFILWRQWRNGAAGEGSSRLKRGGLMAPRWRKLRAWMSGAALCAVVAMGVQSSMMARAVESPDDRSVGNRLVVWKEGLRMLADNPRGVGAGRSGEIYTQWYRPLASTTRYRTLVNSYLTFAAERGLPWFALALFAGLTIWIWLSRGDGDWKTGLSASILVFAITGLFSTTMENWIVWIPSLLAVATLAGLRFLGKGRSREARRMPGRFTIAGAGLLAVGATGGMAVAGWWIGREAPLEISISSTGAAFLTPSDRAKASRPPVLVLPDREVLGDDFGKLLRRLALEVQRPLMVWGRDATIPKWKSPPQVGLVCGEAIERLNELKFERLILLAPARPPGEAIAAELPADGLTLVLPSFDEDGRVRWWREWNATGRGNPPVTLTGVGTRVEWAWDEVVALVGGP